MRALVNLVYPRAMRHSASLEALERRIGREVDIQASIRRQTLFEHHLHNLYHPVAQRREVGILIIVAATEGNARNVLHAPLLGNAHRARIVVVDARVVAMIDAADNQVGSTLGKKLIESQFYTVNRCSAARPHLHIIAHIVATLQAKRRRSREGAGKTRASTLRGND